MIAAFLIIHGIICIITIFLILRNDTENYKYLIPAVICVPVGGAVLYFLERNLEKHNRFNQQKVDLDKLKIEDVKYRRIDVDDEEDEGNVVPLEEAMTLNDSQVKRKLLMKVLDSNPEKNIDLLQEARLGTDTEITHYATTTMVEIQATYEKKIQELSEDIKKMPNNERLLNSYRRELTNYINSGLITGNILTIYRRQLAQVLAQLINLSADNIRLYVEQIENLLELGDYEEVEKELAQIKKLWPMDERVYKLSVKYYWCVHRGDKIQETLREIHDREVYLSHSGQQWYTFWQQKES